MPGRWNIRRAVSRSSGTRTSLLALAGPALDLSLGLFPGSSYPRALLQIFSSSKESGSFEVRSALEASRAAGQPWLATRQITRLLLMESILARAIDTLCLRVGSQFSQYVRIRIHTSTYMHACK